MTAQFASGKLYVIVGDNGAGKTTFLRTIAGLAQQSRGTISVLGSPEIKNVRAQIGYMAHPSLLYDDMSGMENLTYFAGLYGLPHARCREAISDVKLDPDLERHGVDLDGHDVGHEAVAERRIDLVVVGLMTRLGRRERRVLVQPRLAAESSRIPVHEPGGVSERHRSLRLRSHSHLPISQL